MLAEIGSVAIGLALAAAAYAAFAAARGIRREDARWTESAQTAVRATAVLLGLAVGLLLAAFLSDAFQIRYVAHHSNRALPTYLKASAVWAGQEGSLLAWAFLQALFGALTTANPNEGSRPLIPWVTMFLSLITALFAAAVLFLSNPFIQADPAPIDGLGMNPLLRHPGMVFHPPALFVGYAGLAVPFAFGLAGLVTRRVDEWSLAARRWALIAWLFLGIGLLLGARWAYDVLGWGGYWGWDPVENAGLMPWLAATALLHAMAIQKQGAGFRPWTVILAVLSFALVLFGTFATRSGMIASVHAFARSPLGYYFLALIAAVLIASATLLISSRDVLAGEDTSDSLLSREGTFYLTLVLLLTLTASIWVGSVLPTLTGGRFEAPPAWFDRVTGPQFAALVLLMGVCPLLGRSVEALRHLRRRGWPALLGMVLVPVLAAAADLTGWPSLIGFALIGLAGGTAVAELVHNTAAARRRDEQGRAPILVRSLRRNLRRYGATLVHTGIVLMALGVIGTRLHVVEDEMVVVPGELVYVGEYTLLLEELRPESDKDHAGVSASLAVYRDNTFVATLEPQMRQYTGHQQVVSVPALRSGLREDLYVVLAGWESDGTTTLKVLINPLAGLLWVGGLVLLTGGGLALWPAPSTALPIPSRSRTRVAVTAGLVAGLVALAIAAVAMWGPSVESTGQSSGRPLQGQSVPEFSLTLLDGSTIALSQLRGRVVVVNFWASWCPPCEEELPHLQAIWEAYEAQGTVVLGIAFDKEGDAIQEMASRLGVTYPLGLDEASRISASFGVTAVPETFVVDDEGRVAFIHIGRVSEEQLRGELDELLGD
jgi:cytochrome c-type biogenesis protein CcmF